jgi:hypothetical protein
MSRRTEEQAEILVGLAELRPKVTEDAQAQVSHSDILAALDQFMECVRYLNVRRSSGLRLKLDGEPDVQDAIYLMLRPWVTDLVYENPTGKVASRFAVKDFLAKGARTVIEAKFIRDEAHGRSVSKELHDDIEMYRRHPGCDHLIFFIYDANSLIPDVAALRAAIESSRVYEGQPLYCHVLVKP